MIKTRFIAPITTELRISYTHKETGGYLREHTRIDQRRVIPEKEKAEIMKAMGSEELEKYAPEGYEVSSYGFHYKYPTKSGDPEPGDLYYSELYNNMFWDNDDGPHLFCVLPNGRHWDIDSRASNCTMKEDRTHRCWCRHGNPETGPVTVDKVGHTCAAGAGSIQMGDYHGFLKNGILT